MTESVEERGRSVLQDVSNALVQLRKKQFGRGATQARASFAGPDTLICVLRDVLLPAELTLIKTGNAERVTDTRTSYQAATRNEFEAGVENILQRKVIAFASAVDPASNVVSENFVLEPTAETAGGSGVVEVSGADRPEK